MRWLEHCGASHEGPPHSGMYAHLSSHAAERPRERGTARAHGGRFCLGRRKVCMAILSGKERKVCVRSPVALPDSGCSLLAERASEANSSRR
eukprot:1471022-Prymnesium_polylepis.3